MEKVVEDLQSQLRSQYNIPGKSSVHIAQGGNVMTKGPDGKMVIVPRASLKTVAGARDFLWDQDAGKMFKLSLYLGEVHGDNKLDEEDEIFQY
jgi:hypothetical protein